MAKVAQKYDDYIGEWKTPMLSETLNYVQQKPKSLNFKLLIILQVAAAKSSCTTTAQI